jgi:hypothetical protein
METTVLSIKQIEEIHIFHKSKNLLISSTLYNNNYGSLGSPPLKESQQEIAGRLDTEIKKHYSLQKGSFQISCDLQLSRDN